MKKDKKDDELLPEYDFDYLKATRGKYSKKLMDEGSNCMILNQLIKR